MKWIWFYLISSTILLFSSCTEDIDVELPEFKPDISVEAYINTRFSSLNYVILSRSTEFYDPNFITPIGNAKVTITPGSKDGDEYTWDRSNSITLQEINNIIDLLPDSLVDSINNSNINTQLLRGAYVDPTQTFLAQPETHYLLEVEALGKQLTSTTYVPEVVEMDTVTYRWEYNDNIDSNQAFVTIQFKDPDEFGNSYLFYVQRFKPLAQFNFPILPTWGSADLDILIRDEAFNATDYKLTSIFPFKSDEDPKAYLAHIDRESYEFWFSYRRARSNGGPFQQPIQVKSNINGGFGIFCGMAVDYYELVLEEPE